jgi:hypothetical protein
MSRAIPELLSVAKYVPIFYPLRLAGRIAANDDIREVETLPTRAQEALSDAEYLFPTSILLTTPRRQQSFRQLLQESDRVAINHGVWCRYDEADVVALREFLVQLLTRSRKISTDVARLACKYDRLVYGFDYEGDAQALRQFLDVEAPISGDSLS